MLALASFIVLLTFKGFKCKVNIDHLLLPDPSSKLTWALKDGKSASWYWKWWVLRGWPSRSMEMLKLELVPRIRDGLSSVKAGQERCPAVARAGARSAEWAFSTDAASAQELKINCEEWRGKKKSWETKLGISLWQLWISVCVEEWNSQILKQEMPVHSHNSFLFSPFRTLTFPTPMSGLFSFLKWAKLCLLFTIPGEKNGVLLCAGICSRVFSLFR